KRQEWFCEGFERSAQRIISRATLMAEFLVGGVCAHYGRRELSTE
ncbi:unnamed protein product, partial [marine sediment metagenome]